MVDKSVTRQATAGFVRKRFVCLFFLEVLILNLVMIVSGAEGRRRGRVPRAIACLGGRSTHVNRSIYGIHVMISRYICQLLASMPLTSKVATWPILSSFPSFKFSSII